MYETVLHDIVKRLRQVFKFSIRMIASMLNISKTTIHRWLHSANTGCKNISSTKRFSIDLQHIVTEQPFQTLSEIINNHNLGISTSTLCRYMRKQNITRKKVYQIGPPDMEKVIKQRKVFSDTITQLCSSDILSVDESSLYSRMSPRQGWSKKGIKLTCPIQRKQSQRYTLTAAISSDGLVHLSIVSGSSNEERFLTFIKGLQNAPQKFVMLDNVAFHKTKKVLNAFKVIGKIPIFIPPYSPDWNPVEFYFSMLKSHLRKNQVHKTESQLESVCKDFSTRKTCFNDIFIHCIRNIERCYHP